jgi:four helix bundle protein
VRDAGTEVASLSGTWCVVRRVKVGADKVLGMNYDEWLKTVPTELRDDPLWRMEAYRLAVFASDLAWPDVTKLASDRRTLSLSDQLFRAVGSIAANIAEGYSRGSGKDQARFYEYALGSAREARTWYYQSRRVLSEQVCQHRLRLLTRLARLLLTMIPNERGRRIAEDNGLYSPTPDDLTSEPPLP